MAIAVVTAGTRLTASKLNELINQINSNTAVAAYRDTITTGGTVPDVTFSGIPSTLRKIEITYTARGDAALHTVDVYARINGDTGANYNHGILFSVNAGAPGAGNAVAQTQGQVGACTAASAPAGRYGGGRANFIGWNAPHTSALVAEGFGGGISAAANSVNVSSTWVYVGAGPYTSITLRPLSGNFVTGSEFILVGFP